jgi:hypothetical protein
MAGIVTRETAIRHNRCRQGAKSLEASDRSIFSTGARSLDNTSALFKLLPRLFLSRMFLKEAFRKANPDFHKTVN